MGGLLGSIDRMRDEKATRQEQGEWVVKHHAAMPDRTPLFGRLAFLVRNVGIKKRACRVHHRKDRCHRKKLANAS